MRSPTYMLELIRKICIVTALIIIAASIVLALIFQTEHVWIGITIASGILLLLCFMIGIIVHLFIVKYKKQINKIVDGDHIAKWQCPLEQWQQHQGEQIINIDKQFSLNYKVLAVLAPLILALYGWELTSRDNMTETKVMIILGISACLIVVLFWFAKKLALTSIEKNKDQKATHIDIYISSNAVLLGDAFVAFNDIAIRPSNILIQEINGYNEIFIEINISKRMGAQELRVPIPKGKEAEAETVVHTLKHAYQLK